MLKITTTVAEDGTLTIGIAGRLTPDGCHAVDQILKGMRPRQVKIDLSGVRLVDRPSIEYLVHVRERHVALINLPSYVSRWVEQVWNQLDSGNSGDRRSQG